MTLPATPLLMKNKIKDWEILRYGEDDWCQVFQGERLRFRKGDNVFRQEPYWEQTCDEETKTLRQFFEVSKTESGQNHWLYYDYKYMKDILAADSGQLEGVKWKVLGLENLSGRDSTMWIGNRGAHTPCHMDTYGCNVVAQIMGRKLWILAPPTESDSLSPTRVPYEESSIYSSLNFYTPTLRLLDVKNALKVILNPGDVLFVPKHWWHYVENLDVAVSVNAWVPLLSDNESRLDEALVRHYVSNTCQMLPENDSRALLNPNEYELLSSPFDEDDLELIVGKYQDWLARGGTPENELEEFAQFVSANGVKLEALDEAGMEDYVRRKCQLHNYSPRGIARKTSSGSRMCVIKQLVNSYCHPRIVSSIRDRLVGMRGVDSVHRVERRLLATF